MDIDKLAVRFVALANKQSLSKIEHGEAQRLMQQLKEAGMSNEEISKLSKGRWSSSSVKGYVTGVKGVDPSPWGDAISLLNDAINMGISLDEIQTTVRALNELTSQGVNIDQVVSLLAMARSASVDTKALVQQHENLKSCNLSMKDIGKALDLKRELEERGLSLQSLPHLVKLAKNFGDVQGILESVSKYGTMKELNEEISNAEGRLKSVTDELASKTEQLDRTEARLSHLKQPLADYENVVKLGFSESALRELLNLTNKFGGVKKVFEAMKAYADYVNICNETGRAKTTLGETKAKIARLEEQHSHLKTAIELCDSLVHKFKFGLDAITTIYSAAQKYQEPINVLKAIEEYGKVLTIQQEKVKLEARVSELGKLVAELEARYQETLNHLESLNAQALKTGQDIGRLQAEFKHSKDMQRFLNLLNDPESASFEEHGQMALVLGVSLRRWVITHQQKFKFAGSIKPGLENLIKELGGI